MSIIAVKRVPSKWSLVCIAKELKKVIREPFEALNFVGSKFNEKICYVRLSERSDPALVVENICAFTFLKGTKLQASLPCSIPDITLAPKMKKGFNKGKGKGKGKKKLQEQPYQVIQRTHYNLMQEIQYKYPGLYNLSLKTGHQLLEEIAKIIFDRLKNIMGTYVDTRNTCFGLSGQYRKTHPHFGDFQMILSQLHALQDANGAPRLQVNEAELKQMPIKPSAGDAIPQDQVRRACTKYTDRVVKGVVAHIKSLSTTEGAGDLDVSKKKVREELHKMLPYIPSILKQIVPKHFAPQNVPYHRIRIYGEPFLPSRDAMAPFVRRYHANSSRVIRHPAMYNLLLFKIPHNLYAPLMAMDGTVINGAKLVIRSDLPLYESSMELRTEMAASLGGPRGGGVETYAHDEFEDYEDMERAD